MKTESKVYVRQTPFGSATYLELWRYFIETNRGVALDQRLANVIFLEKFLAEIDSLDNREKAIVSFRLLAYKKSTLDEIGSRFGLTRERVRQIEGKLSKSLAPILKDLRSLYEREIDTGKPTSFTCMLSQLAPFGSRAIEKIGSAEVDFSLLGATFGLYEVENGLCFVPNKEAVKTAILSRAKEQSPKGLFSLDEFPIESFVHGPMSNSDVDRSLRTLGLTQLGSGDWLQASNYIDAAAALLEDSGEPVKLETLKNQIDGDISLRSFRQRLMADTRFAFPDSSHIRIVKEGQEAVRPKSISELISEIVTGYDSRVPFPKVLEYVQSRKTAAESSVRSFASRFPYAIRDNLVYKSKEQAKKPQSQPAGTKNLFKVPDGWVYRLLVNAEHLRGSSITLPVSFVNAFNLRAGLKIEFEDFQVKENLWMNWDGSQPKARSIRRNLISIGAQTGQHVMLSFCNGTFRVSPIAKPKKLGPEALSDMFPNLYGLSVDVFLREAFMCTDLGGIPLLEAMKLRREFDLVELFEGRT